MNHVPTLHDLLFEDIRRGSIMFFLSKRFKGNITNLRQTTGGTCVVCMLLITGADRGEVSEVWEVVVWCSAVLWRLLLFVWLWSRKA